MMKGIPVLPILGGPRETLRPMQLGSGSRSIGSRKTTCTAELLDADHNVLGPLPGYVGGGEVSWSASASVKGAGSLPITVAADDDLSTWVGKRIRLGLTYQDDNEDSVYSPLGVWVPKVPSRKHTGTSTVSYTVTLLDKLTILDNDTYHDNGDNNASFSVSEGDNILEAVVDVIASGGEDASYISTDSAAISADRVWKPTATRLQIINDLLDAANYFSLVTGRDGYYRTIKYRSPQYRSVIYADGSPFSDSSNSRMLPEWKRSRDVAGVPNRWLSVAQADGKKEPDTAVAEDATGTPYSYDRVGYWRTGSDENVASSGHNSLEKHAERKLLSAQTTNDTIEVSHLFLEDMVENAVVRFEVGGRGLLTTTSKTAVSLSSTGTCKSTLKVVEGDG